MEVLQRTANRGSISTASYEIGNSIKFESANTESLTKSQTASNRRTWTVSFWFKKTKVDSALQYIFEAGSSSSTLLSLFVNGTTDWRIYEYVSGSRNLAFYSTSPLRDSAAWYHIVIACDTTQSTAADRFRIYLNGVDLTAISGYFSTAAFPAQNYETRINDSASTLSIGKAPTASTNFCGYISEFNFIDGLMKDEEDFGEYDSNGIWRPIEYKGSYGNQGYFLNFADAGDLGDDESGNGKDFTENNIAAIDQATDSPTNNFATMNVLNPLGVYSEGATKVTSPVTPNIPWATSSIAISHGGKWYCEVKLISANNSSGSNFWQNGITPHQFSDSWNYTIMYRSDGLVLNLPNSGTSTGNASFAANDIMGMAYDSSNKSLKFYKNGSLVLTKTVDVATPAEDYFFGAGATNGGTYISNWNFGGYTASAISSAATDANGYGTFEYAPPSGYLALCTKNLAETGG